LTIFYLDDLTVGDNQTKVAADELRIKENSESIALSLTISKYELVCQPNTSIVDTLLQSLTPRNTEDASLLGAPLFTGLELDHTWSTRLFELERAVERLSM